MTVRKHRKQHPFQADVYTVSGFMAETKTSRDGTEIYEPARLFPYANGTKFAICISIVDHTTVDGEVEETDIDCICWNDSEWKFIKKMNLAPGDKVQIKGEPSTNKDTGKTSLIFKNAGSVIPVKSL